MIIRSHHLLIVLRSSEGLETIVLSEELKFKKYNPEYMPWTQDSGKHQGSLTMLFFTRPCQLRQQSVSYIRLLTLLPRHPQ